MGRNVMEKHQYDEFKDDRFSSEAWSASRLTLPQEIHAQIDSFALCGRTIKRMQMIGMSYAHQGISIESTAYSQLMHLPEEEREHRSSYHNIDDEIVFTRWAEIDEPFMIEFEDGDVFEIDIPWEAVFRMSMNRIPWYVEHEVNVPNLDAEVLFSNCIGRTITAVELNHTTLKYDPNSLHSFEDEPYERKFISDITLRMDDGTALRFYGRDDFCEVECIDADDEVLTMRYGELKEGLHNWEDLHVDKVTGFEAESSMVFFNEKGKEYADGIYLTFVSSRWQEAELYISEDNIILIDWCVSLKIDGWFDEYSAYHFSYEEWEKVLAEADGILTAGSFDELFDMLIARQGGKEYMMTNLNFHGADFWKNRERYRRQFEDLRRWSKIVLKRGDIMNIYGY